MALKIEKRGFWFIATDTLSGTEILSAPSKDVLYSEKEGVFCLIYKEKTYSYPFSELVDLNSAPFETNKLAKTFLEESTGGNNVAVNAVSVIGPLTDEQLRASAIPISPRPNTTGSNGTTPYKLISLATTNANVVKASPGNLYSIVANGKDVPRYIKSMMLFPTPLSDSEMSQLTTL